LRNFLLALGLLLLFWAGAHVVAMYVPEGTEGWLGAIRQIADFFLGVETWLYQNVNEPIQWLMLGIGFFVTAHAVFVGNGLLALLGINLMILGLAWQYAKGIYDFALAITGSPVAAVIMVVLAGWLGAGTVKWLLSSGLKRT